MRLFLLEKQYAQKEGVDGTEETAEEEGNVSRREH